MKTNRPSGALSVTIMSAAYAVAMFHRAAFGSVSANVGAAAGLDAGVLAMIGAAFFWDYLLF